MKRFAIMGCYRSGTTILRLCLNSHPSICCFDEIMSYAVARALQANDTLDCLDPRISLVGCKLPAWTEYASLDPYRKHYEGVPILFLERDVRAVVASMAAFKPNGVPYIRKFANDVVEWTKHGHTLTEADKHQASGLVDDFERAAFFWKVKRDSLEAMQRAGLNVLVVRYEELTADPVAVLGGVCGFLGVPFADSMLDPSSKVHSEAGIGGTLASPIHGESVEKWRGVLTEDQERRIMAVVG